MRVLTVGALFFVTISADAQILSPDYDRSRDAQRDPYYRDDPYYGDSDTRRERRRDRRRDRRDDAYGSYGYSGDPLNIANRVMSDVRRVASNNSVEKHDRKHFEEVEEELGKFTRKYRDGKFDKNNLKDAAESLQHLASSNAIRSSRDRRILQDSLGAIQSLRSGSYDMSTTRSRRDDGGSIWDVFGR